MFLIKKYSVAGRFFLKVLSLILLCALIIVSSLYVTKIITVSNYDYQRDDTNNELVKSSWGMAKAKEANINNKKPTIDIIIQDIQDRMSNLPILFFNRTNYKRLQFNSTCAKLPDFFNIEYSNAYWQRLETTNGTFQLYNAYLDVRKNNAQGPSVRILGMINRIQPVVKTHCHIWFENQTKTVISPIIQYKYIWVNRWGNYRQGINQPYLMTCQIPIEHWKGIAPSVVSIVEKPCDRAVNALKIIYNKPASEKKDFAVCVKGMNFPYDDLSVRLAEWIELVNLLGADKIFFYELTVHPNVKRLLDYYENEGKVHVTPLKLPGDLPSEPLLQYYFLNNRIVHKRQNELIPYNDCFYKHMYEYRYIVLLDTDEVIMPKNVDSWKELIDDVLVKAKTSTKSKLIDRTSISARNVYFLDDLLHNHGWFDDIPRYMHMLQHVYRAKNYTKPGFYIKSFFNTEKVLTLHNHYPFDCLGGCFQYSMDTADAQLQHYRRDCVAELRKSCDDFKTNSIMDATIWKFKEPLMERVRTALNDLGYSENQLIVKR